MASSKKQFLSTNNIGGKDTDNLKPRIESEYTTENQAVRKLITDFYSDKPFKNVKRFPGQVLRVLEASDIKKDNYLNNLLAGLPNNPQPEETTAESVIKKITSFAGFGEKRYKVRVLDLDIGLPPVSGEGDKAINPLTSIPANKTEAEIIKDNLLIDYIYTTEFVARNGISCDVGDIVVVYFDNKNNRNLGIIEQKLTGAPTVIDSKNAPSGYKNPSGKMEGVPPTPDNTPLGAPPVEKKIESITKEQLKSIFPQTSDSIIITYTSIFNELFPKYKINTNKRIAAFLGQIAVESGYLTTTRELRNRYNSNPDSEIGSKYEKRSDLGNKYTGDGPRFIGRGLIQLTGRDNYERIAKKLKIKIDENPELVEEPKLAAEVSCVYFVNHCMNAADRWDLVSVTAGVNKNLLGQDIRVRFSERAIKVLGQ